MDPSGDVPVFLLSLLLQGLGGLSLVLVCAALYAHRRRPYLLFWTLSWCCFSALALLRYLALNGAGALPPVAERPPLLTDLAAVSGALHLALWVFGLWSFHRERSASESRDSTGTGSTPARVALVLAATAAAAAATGLLSWPVQTAILAVGMALVYGGSVVSLLWSWRSHRLGRVSLAVFLALSAASQGVVAGVVLTIAWTGLIPRLAGPATFLDFFLQLCITGAMILVLLGEEQRVVRDSARRLTESEGRFRLLFEHGGVGLALLAPDGRIVEANPALEKLLGYSSEELRGLRLTDVTDPRDRAKLSSSGQPVDESWGPSEREKRYLRKDGGVVWARVLRAPVRGPDGTVNYHASVLMDVTARRRAEEALTASEQRLRLRFHQAFDGILLWSEAGAILEANPALGQMLGRSRGELLGLTADDVADDPEALRRHLEGVRAHGSARCETPLRRGDGSVVDVEVNSALVEIDGERLIQGICRDVSERKRALTAERRLEGQLAHARKMEMLATLVGGLAHDFNNQLTAVVGNLALALDDLKAMGNGEWGMGNAEKAPGHSPFPIPHSPLSSVLGVLGEAERAARRCADMTARLLTFSRGRVGKPQRLRLDQLLPEAVRLLRQELPPSIPVEVEAPDDVWPVTADWGQLHQVLHALATNARDAMPDGGKLTFALSNRLIGPEECAADVEARPGRFVELLARDEGRGMTPEVRARIFEPFFTTKKAGEGVGLGLSVVFGLVKGYGGWVAVQSEPGRGAAFRIFLPAGEEAPAPVPADAPPARGGHECILVVDDERPVRLLVQTVLERRGFRVLTAADGREALAVFREHHAAIDLVLLDYSMPGATGLEVLQALQQIDPAVCAVFSSGYALDGDASPLLNAGARAFVPKPYSPQELVEALRRVLDESEAEA